MTFHQYAKGIFGNEYSKQIELYEFLDQKQLITSKGGRSGGCLHGRRLANGAEPRLLS